jgi:hypothetical protein
MTASQTRTKPLRMRISNHNIGVERRLPRLQALLLLDGHWTLLYTSNGALRAFLDATSALPGISVGRILQSINSRTLTAESRLQLTTPVRLDLSTSGPFPTHRTASISQHSSKEALRTMVPGSQLALVKAGARYMYHVQTPEVFAMLVIPAVVRVGSINVDLAPLQQMLHVVQDGIRDVQWLVLQASQGRREAAVPDKAESGVRDDSVPPTLLTTFVDANTRLSRAVDGSLFVFVKQAAAPVTQK